MNDFVTPRPIALIFILISISINQVQAAGFALINNNASGMGAAYSGGSSIANDASTVFFNPAGMVRLTGEHMLVATHMIIPQAQFNNQGSSAVLPIPTGSPLSGADEDGGETSVVANFFYTYPIDDKLTFGFGLNTPFGLKTTYDKNWVGRYHAVNSELLTINLNPSIAYKLNNKLAIGGGINAQYAEATLSSAIDIGSVCLALVAPTTCSALGTTPQQADGFASVNGDDFSFGWNIGVLFQPTSSTRIGAAYRSKVKHTLKGQADFTTPPAADAFIGPSGSFVDTGASAKLTLPELVSVSIFHKTNNKIDLMADISWMGWDSFQELRIQYDNALQPDSVTTENWKNVFRYSVGMQYHLNNQWLLRLGLAYDKSPVPSPERRTPRAPGLDRSWLSFGFSYVLQEKLTFDFGYTHIFDKVAKVNNTLENSIPPLNATLTGEFQGSADLISAQLSWSF
jgi:long-chain fatty acid transport protein